MLRYAFDDWSPLRGLASPFGVDGFSLIDYAANGFTPELVADFGNDLFAFGSAKASFADMFGFTRASVATYVDASGVIQSAASGAARTQSHMMIGGIPVMGGFLAEGASSNNLLHSADMTNAAYTLINSATISANQGAAPDGVTAMDLLTAASTGNLRGILQNHTVGVAGLNCFSTFIKVNSFVGTAWVKLQLTDFGLTGDGAWFNLTAGSAGTVEAGLHSSGIEDWGGGLYRIWVVADNSADTTGGLRLYFADGDASDAVGDATDSLLIWGWQSEPGALPSSYIPTTTGAVARAADVLTLAGSKTPVNTTFFSMAAETYLSWVDTDALQEAVVFDAEIDANNLIRWFLRSDSSRAGRPNVWQRDSGTLEIGEFANGTPGLNEAVLWAARHGATLFQSRVQSTTKAEDATPVALVDISGIDHDIMSVGNGHMNVLRMWGTDIGQAGIEAAAP